MAKKRKKAKKSKASKAGKGKRPLKFLIAMRNKMEKNLPKLDAIIKARGGK